MNCVIEVKALNSLRKLVGNNDNLYLACYSESVGSDNQLTDGFKSWYLKTYNKNIESAKALSGKKMAEAVLAYHYYLHPDGNITARSKKDSNKVITFGYTDTVSRNFAKHYTANQMVIAASSEEARSISDINKRREYLIAKAKNNIKAELVTRIEQIKNISREQAIEEFKKGIKNLDDIFNDENTTTQDKNLYALFNEIISRSRVENNNDKTLAAQFFDEVLMDNRLQAYNYKHEVNDELNEELSTDEQSTETDEKAGEEEKEDYKDEFIANTEHSGLYSSFKKHINDKLNLYLSTIPKLLSTEGDVTNRQNDINNPLGVQDFHSPNELFSVLYSGDIDYTNINTMLDSIKAFAERNKTYSGMIKLYEDMSSNFNLACEFYSTFSKIVISKQELIQNGDSIKVYNNNRNIDKETVLRFEYANTLRHSILNIDKDVLRVKYLDITTDIDRFSKSRKGITQEKEYNLINKVSDLVQSVFTTIDKNTVDSFIRNRDTNIYTGIRELLTSVVKVIQQSDEVKANYINLRNNIKAATYKNKQLDLSKRKDTLNRQEIWNKYSNGEYPKAEDYDNVNALYEEEYLTNQVITIINDLANKLKPYSTIKTELNSYNVHGNQSSNVINSSWLTGFMKMLDNEVALGNYGKFVFQGNQFDLSNILVEKRDEHNDIINYGLFREVNGVKVPTEYAGRLLKIKLFDGATDANSNTSATYSEMSETDYVVTAFYNFFNNKDKEDLLGNVSFGDYFMRTPSDASRNFIVSMPRYSTENLLVIEDEFQVKNDIEKEIQNIAKVALEDRGLYDTLTPSKSNLETAIKDIAKSDIKDKFVRLSEINGDVKQLNDGDITSVTFEYKDKKDNATQYVLEGEYTKTKNGSIILKNPKFIGILSQDVYGVANINDDIKQALYNKKLQERIVNNEIKQKVNVNHPIYKQYYNVFIQELTNAKTAFDKIFELTESGEYEPKLDPSQTYANYHQKGGKFYVKDSNGRKLLVGNVFISNKFKLNGKNYLGELFAHKDNSNNDNASFDFFYGGATAKVIQDATTGKLQLTEQQHAAVEEALKNYIQDFISSNIERLFGYNNVIDEKELTTSNITDFTVNYNLAYMSFDDIFEGSMNFYKDTQTALKRAKEVQGSGISYGIFDYNKDYTKVNKEEIVASPLAIPFKKIDKDGKVSDYIIKQYDGFYGVTIKNTIRTQKEVEPNGLLAKKLATIYQKDGLSKKEALEKANKFLSRYIDTTVNDAQSYITFDEWIRRITARGQFEKYKPIIEAILDESKPLTPDVIDQFIQVQKNFYYDFHYNAQLGVLAPRQIKNAEFVLVPRLIEGSELEQVYKLMSKFGIDQLNTEETSKAGKNNILTIWDNDGNLDKHLINDLGKTKGFKSDFAKRINDIEVKQLFDYNHLYTQQETPQHVNAENKAAIQIMKKIVDNVDSNSPLYKYKEEFMRLHSANVEESFIKLMSEIGVEVDENNNIKLNNEGNIEHIDFKVFFEKLQAEAQRQALDSNAMNFLTINEEAMFANTPSTRMPLIMSNISTKLENIAQAMFNNTITRQKLPGFHAAQITNIGFKSFNDIINNNIFDLHLDKDNWKASGKIIDSTRSACNICDTTQFKILKYLEKQGLKASQIRPTTIYAKSPLSDDLIEHKIIELKINDKYYIYDQPQSEFIHTTGKTFTEQGETLNEGKIDDTFNPRLIEVTKDNLNKIYQSAERTDYNYENLTKDVELDNINHNTDKPSYTYSHSLRYHSDKNGNYTDYVEIMLPASNFGFKRINEDGSYKTDEELLKELQNAGLDEIIGYRIPTEGKQSVCKFKVVGFTDDALGSTIVVPDAWVSQTGSDFDIDSVYGIQYNTKIDNYGEIQKVAYNEVSTKSYNKYVEDNVEDKTLLDNPEFNHNNWAVENGLLSRDEWSKENLDKVIKDNSKAARQNKMLDDIKTILSYDESLEENLSCSQFADLIEARNELMSDEMKAKRSARTSYNFLDQAAYQYDAMSGAKLKAFSVTRDTFCSICNTVRPILSEDAQFTVVLPADKYNIKEVKAAFGNNATYNKANNTITLKVDKFGWSENNKNIVGKILTAYSSETTAHILDAVKEGVVPNENDYTFAVFKMFPDLGLDYTTACAFIIQPAITRIVDAYNANKSIYTSGNFNPIHTAIKDIAKDLGLKIEPTTKINEAINLINNNNKLQHILKTEFGVSTISLDPYDIKDFHFNVIDQIARINNTGKFDISTPVKGNAARNTSLLFDILTVLQFNKLNNTAQTIGDITRVFNPDKFGAKQSIFATEKVFDDINILLERDKGSERLPLLVGEDNIITAVYPGVEQGFNKFIQQEDRIKDSKYPTLYSFLKYATAPSIKVNKKLFATKATKFDDIVKSLDEMFSNGKVITEKTYNEFSNYVLSSLYNQTPVIKQPLYFDVNNGLQPLIVDDPNIDELEEERLRIYGFNKDAELLVTDDKGNTIEFTVEDANNPTEVEVKQFLTLSPAQKVLWIQQRFDNGLVTKYLRANISGSRFNTAPHSIRFIENSDNVETIYDEFYKTLNNSNPLLAATAVDLIKYAFVVEGYKMKRGGVSKVIKNTALYDSLNDNGSIESGIGFTFDFEQVFDNFVNFANEVEINTIKENYLRSTPNSNNIVTKKIQKVNKVNVLGHSYYGMYQIDTTNEKVLLNHGIIYEDKTGETIYNKYVRLKDGNQPPVLYKIFKHKDNVFLIPLNELIVNENAELSIDASKNKYPSKAFYWEAIKDFTGGDIKVLFDNKWSDSFEDRLKAKGKSIDDYKREVNVKHSLNKTFDLNAPSNEDAVAFEAIRNKINSYFGSVDGSNKKSLWISNLALTKYIKSSNINDAVLQQMLVEQKLDGKSSHTIPMLFSIRKASYKEYAHFLKLKNSNKVIKDNNTSAVKVLSNLQKAVKASGKDFNDYPIFIIDKVNKIDTTDNTEIRLSAIDEGAAEMGVKAFDFTAKAGFESGVKAKALFNDLTGTNNPSAAKQHINGTVRITAEFVDNTVNKLLHDIEYFAYDKEKGENLSIDNPKVMELALKDNVERDRVLALMLTTKGLLDNFVEYRMLDITSEDESIRDHLTTIQNKINQLATDSRVDRAFKNFGNHYLTKLSDDPRFVQDLLTIFDGYHSTSLFEAWINDLQESANPIVQLITSTVMKNITQDELITKERIREFQQFRKDVEKEAKSKGLSIDLNKIVDENTRLIQPYTKELVEEFSNLVQEVKSLKAQGDEMFTEYLLAKHKLDDFKLKHFEQPVVSEYYKEKLRIEGEMLADGIGLKPQIVFEDDPTAKVYDPFQPKEETNPKYKGNRFILSHYLKLKQRQFELRSHVDSEGNLGEYWAEELKKIEDELYKLVYEPIDISYYEGERIPDKEKDPKAYEHYLLYGGAPRVALKKYIQAMTDLNAKYFKYDAIYGFDEELKRNLETIASYEERTATGELKVPMSELMKKPDYVKAKTWITRNARYVHSEKFWKDVKDALLNVNRGTQGKDNTRNLIRKYAEQGELYDVNRVIDASKLTDEQIAAIKESQRKYYQFHQQNGLSDSKLIKNGNRSRTIYTSEFYKRMTSDGEITQEYNELCMRINELLGKVYNSHTKTVRTDEMTLSDLYLLQELYDELDKVTKKVGASNGKEVKKFIKENVDFTITEENQKLFDTLNEWAKAKAETLGEEWYKTWYEVNTEYKRDENDEIMFDENDQMIRQPNSRLYGSITPKKEVADKFTDVNKTKALEKLRTLLKSDKTEYYYRTYQEKLKEGKEAFNKWYEDNHIYDPFKQEVVPLQCWTISVPNTEANPEYEGHYVPAFRNTKRTIKDGRDIHGDLDGSEDMTNYKYKENNLYGNYIKGSGYDSNVVLNEAEQKVKDKFETIIQGLVKTQSGMRYIRDGKMPVERKPGNTTIKTLSKEAAKFIGWVDANVGYEEFYTDASITFANDKTMDMPMLHALESKNGAKFDEKEPQLEDFDKIEDYNKRKAEYDTRKAEFKKLKQKEHNDAVNRDWWEVVEHFMEQAGHFNSIQSNKLLLYYGERMLRDYQVYQQRLGFGHFNKDKLLSDGDKVVYEKATDSKIHGQYVNWLKRILYNQYKEKNNKFTKVANFMQNLTSNTYMMLNLKGGIANILMGETQILGEQFAKEYFNTSDWAKGKAYWTANVLSFIHGMYKDTSISVADAIVKYFNVIDYDELTGQVKVASAEEAVKKLRDLMFTPQAIGEHFMQNGAMFAMMESHRLFENPKYNEQTNAPRYILKNLAEYTRDLADIELKKMLTAEQAKKFDALREEQLKDADSKKYYVRFRKDLTTEFAIRYLSKEERKTWRNNYDKAVKEAKKEFEDDSKHPTLISQFKLANDRKLGFKDDSILNQLPLEDRTRILAMFKRRVVAVNKKIHGNYGKLDRAQIEKYWFGSLVMQYHKHIYPGLMKHFRREGYYNEERGTIEKGCYVSLIDFLKLNARAVQKENNMTNAQRNVVENIQNVLKYSLDYLLQIKATYHTLPAYDKANIRRSLAEIAAVFSALFLAIGARAILDDDEDNFIGNLALYEADRLASESMQYNPIGIYAESKKLWSQPVAATSIVTDLISSAGHISKMLLEGDNYDLTFNSGRFAGQNKLAVYVARRTPLYRQYDGLVHLSDDNHYYKLTGNITSFSQPIYDAISK